MTRQLLIACACVLVLAGCSTGGAAKKHSGASKPASSSLASASSSLTINGQQVDATTGKQVGVMEPGVDPTKPKRAARSAAGTVAVQKHIGDFVAADVAPPLMSDGSIDDSNDPFAGDEMLAMPVPIERDPDTTRGVDAFAQALRGVDADQWMQWLEHRSPTTRAPGPDNVLGSMVKVLTERCGGAQVYSSGIVVADEMVMTTVSAIESPQRRVRVTPLTTQGPDLPAMIRYLDIDDDVAILYVPGLRANYVAADQFESESPTYQRGLAVGAATGGTHGEVNHIPVYVGMAKEDLTRGQTDGFGKKITDRTAYPLAGAIDTGMAGAAVMTTKDPNMSTGWVIQGMVRARVPYRSTGGGLAVPAIVMAEDLRAAAKLPKWHEFRPTGCPQWFRPYRGATNIR